MLQIKVFKSKGAERKHKTDRDRIAKHPEADKLFRPSTDCTVFTTYEEEPLLPPKSEKDDLTVTTCGGSGPGSMNLLDGSSGAQSPISSGGQMQMYHRNSDTPTMGESSPTLCAARQPQADHLSGSISSPLSNNDPSSTLTPCAPATPSCLQLPQSTSVSFLLFFTPLFFSSIVSLFKQQTQDELLNNSSMLGGSVGQFGDQNSAFPFPSNATAVDTYHWLRKHRFYQLAERLCEYTADDLKRLSKNDLLELCDRKDGLRLYNLIHLPEGGSTKLKVFITFDAEGKLCFFYSFFSIVNPFLSSCLCRVFLTVS